MQRSPDGAEDPRALAQRDEQALVRLHKPLVAHHHLEGRRLPDRACVDAAVRVFIRLQHEAEEPGVARPVGLCRHPRHLEVVGHRVAVARRAARTHRRRPAGQLCSQRLLDESRSLHHRIDRGQTIPPAELPGRELAVVFARPILGGRGHRLTAHRIGSRIEEGPQERLGLPDGRHRRDRLPPAPTAVAPLLPLARRVVRLPIVHHHRMARQRERALQHRKPLARRGAQHRHAPAGHQLSLVARLDQRNHLARRDHLHRQLRRHRPDAHRVRHLALRRLCQVHPNQRPDGLIHRQPDAPDLRNLPVFRLVPLRRRDDQIGLLRPLLRLAATQEPKRRHRPSRLLLTPRRHAPEHQSPRMRTFVSGNEGRLQRPQISTRHPTSHHASHRLLPCVAEFEPHRPPARRSYRRRRGVPPHPRC